MNAATTISAVGSLASTAPDPPDPVVAAGADLASAPTPLPSFERFYETDRERLGRAVAFAIGDADLARDAIDEAFVRAYERWAHVSRGNPPGWVYRVALNWSYSVLRRRRLARKHLYDPGHSLPPEIEPAVGEALAELDPKHRSVVVCRHLLGWSVDQTADALGIKAGTVKSRLSRATRQLQTRLAHLAPEDPR